MSNEKQNAGSSKDELVKTKTGDVELTESELNKASGGFAYEQINYSVTEEGFKK